MDHLLLSGQQREGGIEAFFKPSNSFIFGNLHIATVNFHLLPWDTVHLCQIMYGFKHKGKGDSWDYEPPSQLFSREKKLTQHRIGENRCLECFTLPCLINIGRSSWEDLFRVSPHPSGQGLTKALTICCISYASFWCHAFPQNFLEGSYWNWLIKCDADTWNVVAGTNHSRS